jgi:hypothetical protein
MKKALGKLIEVVVGIGAAIAVFYLIVLVTAWI